MDVEQPTLGILKALEQHSFNIIYHTGVYTLTLDWGMGSHIIEQAPTLDQAVRLAAMAVAKRRRKGIVVETNRTYEFDELIALFLQP